LDEGALQSSNVFTGVSAGTHTVTVVDTEGCTFITQTVLVIDYPKYFTPNNDGFNDTWFINNLEKRGLENSTITIFDRYGKLLKQITGSSDGWNGTFNGNPIPSSDYWFEIKLTNGKSVKGHFTLKR